MIRLVHFMVVRDDEDELVDFHIQRGAENPR
jgi:hypothetical protein